jgi:hypothetical protein
MSLTRRRNIHSFDQCRSAFEPSLALAWEAWTLFIAHDKLCHVSAVCLSLGSGSTAGSGGFAWNYQFGHTVVDEMQNKARKIQLNGLLMKCLLV